MLLLGASGASAAGTTSSWASFQGGPGHAGMVGAAEAPAPPLRHVWRWPPTAPRSSVDAATQAVVANGLAIVLTERQVVALDVTDGSVRWTRTRRPGFLDAPAVDPVAGNGGVVVYLEGRQGTNVAVVAAGLTNGAPMWRFAPAGAGAAPAGGSASPEPTPAPSPSSSPAASASPPSAAPGRTRLQRAIRAAPVIAAGSVFVGCEDGTVYALDLATGVQRWSFKAGAPVHTSPAVEGQDVFVVAENGTTGRATLFALDVTTGKQRWTYSPRSVALNASAPTAGGGSVFVGFGDRTVRAFEATTGRLEWTTDVRFPFSRYNGLALAGDALYAFDAAAGLYRFDARSGTRAWDFQFRTSALRSAPLVAGRAVYVGLDDGTVAAVDVGTGNQVWATRLDLGGAGSPAPAGTTIVVPFVGAGGGIVAFGHAGGPLTDIESPTRLHPVVALANFGVSFGLVLAAVLTLFTVVGRRRTVLSSRTGGDPALPDMDGSA